jgi:hypothetical protein
VRLVESMCARLRVHCAMCADRLLLSPASLTIRQPSPRSVRGSPKRERMLVSRNCVIAAIPVRGFSLTVARHAVMPSTHVGIPCFFYAIEAIGAPSAVPSGDVCCPPIRGSRGGVWPRFLFTVDMRGRVASHRRRRRGLIGGSRLATGPSVAAAEGFASRAAVFIGLHALSRGPLAAGHSSTRR